MFNEFVNGLRFKNIIYLVFSGFVAAFLSWAMESFVWLLVKIPFHESGHALCAWLGGKWAIPIFVAGFTFIGQSRSSFFIGLSLLFYFISFFWLFKNKKFLLLSFSLLLFSVFIKMSFRISDIKLEQYIALAGILGEIVLPAFWLCLYFFDIDDIPRWDFWKYPVCTYCMIGFYHSLMMWLRIYYKYQNLPYGSALSVDGASDTSGDLNRLVSSGWTESQITHLYLNSLKISLVLIIGSCIISFLIPKKSDQI